MWFCKVPEDNHFQLLNYTGSKYYAARQPEHLEALTGNANDLDLETAKSLEEEHGIEFTVFVITSDYEDVSEDEPEKVKIETHTHWADSLMNILQE